MQFYEAGDDKGPFHPSSSKNREASAEISRTEVKSDRSVAAGTSRGVKELEIWKPELARESRHRLAQRSLSRISVARSTATSVRNMISRKRTNLAQRKKTQRHLPTRTGFANGMKTFRTNIRN